jgi:hypothetical protein
LEPEDTTVALGAQVQFRVEAQGSSPLEYQWRKDGAIIGGATNNTYVIASVQQSDVGTYTVDVRNWIDLAASRGAILVLQTCLEPPGNLAGWWPADGDTKDSVTGVAATLVNGAAFAAGEVGQAFSFNGVDQCVMVGFSPQIDFAPQSQFTVMAWARPQALGRFQAMLVKGSQQWDWGIYVDPANRFMAGRNSAHVVTSRTAVTGTGWYHVAAVYEAGSWRLYVNGNLEAQGSGVFVTQSGGGLGIGRKGEAALDQYSGSVDEVAIFNRSLAGSEVQAVCQAGSAGMCKALEHALEFDLATLRWDPGAGFRGRVIGSSTRATTVEASSDFVHWTAITNWASVEGVVGFLDASAGSAARRFYRVRF